MKKSSNGEIITTRNILKIKAALREMQVFKKARNLI